MDVVVPAQPSYNNNNTCAFTWYLYTLAVVPLVFPSFSSTIIQHLQFSCFSWTTKTTQYTKMQYNDAGILSGEISFSRW